MAMYAVNQITALLAKNSVLNIRHFIVTSIAVAIPVSLTLFIVFVVGGPSFAPGKASFKRQIHYNATYFQPENPTFDDVYSYSYNDSEEDGSSPTFYLLYSPETPYAKKLVEKVTAKMKAALWNGTIEVQGFDTEKELEIHVQKLLVMHKGYYSSEIPIAGIILLNSDNGDETPISIKYKLRLEPDGFYVPSVTEPYVERGAFSYISSSRDSYTISGFMALQNLIDSSHLEFVQSAQNPRLIPWDIKVQLQRFPYPEYKRDVPSIAIMDAVPFIAIYGLIFLVPVIVKRIVEEKASGIREILRLMGISDWVYWTGTLLSNLVVFFFIVIILITIVCSTYVQYHTGFLGFVIFMFFSIQTIMFCFALSTFFNRPILAVLSTIIIWVLSHSLTVGFMDPAWNPLKMASYPTSHKLATCLLPTMSIHWAYKIMKMQEVRGDSEWINLTKSPFLHEDFSLGMVMGMMVLSYLIYGIITWYVGAVWPWQRGIPKPFYFPFTKAYWFGHQSPGIEFCEMDGAVQSEFFEEESIGANAGVVFSGLTKIFGIGPFQKVAVDSISLKIAKGQITALLGLNGAGKSTTLNMLTGVLPPTHGSIRLNGYDIISQTQQARENLGLCPQEDLLYDQLTVKQHLQFFALIKGCRFSNVDSEVSRIMELLNLTPQASRIAGNLSGGMRRKLSLAIAFIGGSKILVLDEPTAGLDPEARRVVWDALKNLRENRTIILTTHSMEEADALGDRIAIMTRGVIQCCGSPLFLRKKFGAGYYLRVAKGPHCKANQVIDVIQRHLPSSQVENHSTTELIYSLGVKSSEKFGDLFEELEKREKDLGIVGYGVTVTTMEDVFLKVSQMDEMTHGEANGHTKDNGDNSALLDTDFANSILASKYTGIQKTMQVFKGLFMKRLHYTKRHWILFVFLFIIPSALFVFLMWARLAITQDLYEEEFELPLDVFSIFGFTRTVCQTGYDIRLDPLLKGYRKAAAEKQASTTEVDNVSDYILDVGRTNLEVYKREYLVGSTFDRLANGTYHAIAWYNGEAYHTKPLSLNLVYTAFLKHLSNNDNATIDVILQPFEESLDTHMWYLLYFAGSYGSEGTICLGIMMMSFLGSSFIMYPIHERVSNAKLLQMMTGISSFVFWAASFLWDFLLHMASCLILFIIFIIFNKCSSITSSIEWATDTVFFFFILHAWSAIPLAYLLSFVSSSQSSGIVTYNFISIILGIIFTIIALFYYTSPLSPGDAHSWLWLLRLLPTFAFNWGYGIALTISVFNTACDTLSEEQLKHLCPVASNETFLHSCCKGYCGDDCNEWSHPLQWGQEGSGLDAFMLFVDGVIFWAIIFLLEADMNKAWYKLKDFIRRRFPSLDFGAPQRLISLTEDSDVMEERHRAEDLASQNKAVCQEPLVVTNLTKKFGWYLAVDHLSFVVHKEECFGLLGINGAGKTTTFRMLAGDLVLTEGDAQINGHSLREDKSRFQSFIGYCPQEDSHLDRLTGREMLYLFARIRGVQEEKVPRSVDALIQMVGLESHADKLTRTYSGGTRRRLSVAMALIGSPPILFLDEPTSGVDPAARRKIWDTLNVTKQMLGTSIILTSHSMDECEALCSRLTIMVNGQFRCFGGMQYLKSKFGQGFAVIVKLQKGQENDHEAKRRVQQFMESSFKDVSVKGDHQGGIHYHLTDTTIKVSYLFRTMERAKRELNLDDYLISDTSLEQIFLAFARSQVVIRTPTRNVVARTLSSVCPSNVLPCV